MKFYANENNFRLNMRIDDTSKQLMLDLEKAYIVDVSILANVYGVTSRYFRAVTLEGC